MSRPSGVAGVACLVAALLALSPDAFGAPARHRKPKRPTPAAGKTPVARGEPATPPDSGPAAAAAPPDAAPPAPEEPADESPSDDITLAPAAPKPAPPRPSGRRAAAAPSPIDTREDDEALGRREAARLAAGRIEVAVSASVDVGRRHFTYSDPIGAAPRPYLLSAAPLLTFGLEAYPLASSEVPVLRDLGFRGHYSRAFGLDSSTTDGVAIDTSWTRFGGELRQRVLVPGARPLELGVAAGLDASYFGLSSRGSVGALVPAARTVSLRFGLDARVVVAGRLSVLLGGAYLSTTTRGEIYDRFRRPKVAGVDGELGFAFALRPGLEARLDGRYTRYFASFDPEVGDPAVAGGALDEQMQLGVGLRHAH